MPNKEVSKINLTYLLVLSGYSLLVFLLNATAYEWPAIDMFSFFERYYNSEYLENDFFTNAITSEPNPRWIFGYLIISIASFFNIHFYVAIFYLKVIMVVTFPVVCYFMVYSFVKKYIIKDRLKYVQIIIFCSVLFVMNPKVSGIFSIAWWMPYFIQVTAQNVSLYLGFLAIVIKEVSWHSKELNFLAIVLFLLSVFIHPIVGLFVIIFFCLLNFSHIIKEYKYFISFLFITCLIPFTIVKTLFSPEIVLSTKEFIDIYVYKSHASHYHLSQFGSHISLNWIYSFTLMLVLMLVPLIYFYMKKQKKIILLNLLLISSYLFSVLFQYIFIDIFPSKSIAIIGPVRFTQFAYWMIVILWVIMFSRIKIIDKLNFNLIISKSLFFLVFVIYFLLGTIFLDDYKKGVHGKNIAIHRFVSTTDEKSVFASFLGDLTKDIPNIYDRAIFIGNGFPFSESFFQEYEMRRELLYGDTGNEFYRSIKPKDFLNIAKRYRLDYIIIELQYSKQFEGNTPVFENKKIKIYKINDLKVR
ncbi:MAG: Unknown protein [uncultured Campylobacterales bacterium]|uniref:Glycosyltransferase RgtA/B/C/D-like domain-containing protein n=1 Tax=uncultured Campylobacterales bacterium TaxID=352960 RepID=A0A6S6T0C0_9BACT|nr:MAG: Unknown protein [uncultured Campylobacterales bacterium]